MLTSFSIQTEASEFFSKKKCLIVLAAAATSGGLFLGLKNSTIDKSLSQKNSAREIQRNHFSENEFDSAPGRGFLAKENEKTSVRFEVPEMQDLKQIEAVEKLREESLKSFVENSARQKEEFDSDIEPGDNEKTFDNLMARKAFENLQEFAFGGSVEKNIDRMPNLLKAVWSSKDYIDDVAFEASELQKKDWSGEIKEESTDALEFFLMSMTYPPELPSEAKNIFNEYDNQIQILYTMLKEAYQNGDVDTSDGVSVLLRDQIAQQYAATGAISRPHNLK
ncbi:MAG: hypothetical protein J0L93_10425 [Deltaproteobacteria bacterium]|nr:hypothetical protein [Deltaproteobacteria bacterium]